MRKLALIALLSLPLAASEATASSLFLPMEPTQASIDARRRELTEAEKETIGDAVLHKLGDTNRSFRWGPLVLQSHDHLTDYCGLVGEYVLAPQLHEIFRRYYAQLSFDRHGKLASVDVVSIDDPRVEALPTEADSICIQGGYHVTP